jgi:predicted CoA-substrate-specific enzyme activase
MAITLGLDIGLVSIKLAAFGDEEDRVLFKKACQEKPELFYLPPDTTASFDHPHAPFLVTRYRRIKGKPAQATEQILKDFFSVVPKDKIKGIRITGSANKLISSLLGVNRENDFKATAAGVQFLHPDVRTIFEMGGESSKYIRLQKDPHSGKLSIVDYEKSGDCAAGTGSFMDQQASRLRFDIEKVGDIVMATGKEAKVAGRCSVFAKSDMIHAQQKGYTPPEVLKGLCQAVVRNFKGSITKGKKIVSKVTFLGGVAINKGIAEAMREVFQISTDDFIISPYYAWMGAIGSALVEKEAAEKKMLSDFSKLHEYLDTMGKEFPVQAPLSLDKVVLLRDRVKPYTFTTKKGKIDAYLGIDIGSVSTNLAVIDENGDVIKAIYLKTEARPIEIVNNGLQEIEKDIGDRIEIKGVGTTGSGRELIGELIGADSINDEITGHKTGASFIGQKLLNVEPDTIFDIGGQDSKYISLDKGIVVDFTMNEACAAGTGSFLEERAEELEINIINEFAKMALSSKAPVRLGERCTVFMEQDVNTYQQRGAAKKDLVAGLAYSVVYNYINRVVRGRKIGNVIFFQGGTAYNDAVAAAFTKVLGKEIIVPPHNGVLGAIGAALLVQEKIKMTGAKTTFRGYDLSKIDYTLKEFVCKACSNYCDIQMFKVEGKRTYWGDKCSHMFRSHTKSEKEPVIPDLLKLRLELLFKGYEEGKGTEPKIGFPRTMYMYERFPFWNTFFKELNFRIYLSDETNKQISNDGIEASVAEPCHPIKMAHGHVKNLIDKGVDYIFIPNTINAPSKFHDVESFMCPWGQTLPFIISNSPKFIDWKDRILKPNIRFRLGKKFVARELIKLMKQFKISKKAIIEAVDKAYAVQNEFYRTLVKLGEEALAILKEKGEEGILLVGRPYNTLDKGVNLDIPNKLRDYYGANVIPMDFLPIDDVEISDINYNMFWNYGRRIIAAAKIAKNYPNLHILYITNFKCGPDSYIKHFIVQASGKPYLSLQFDGHSNDAGFITRCEAYLDSKGVLRWWRKERETAIP